MGITFLIILGAVSGGLAGMLVGSRSIRAWAATVIAGVGSALASGLLFPPLLGYQSIITNGDYPGATIIIAFAGTFLLLALAIFITRQRA